MRKTAATLLTLLLLPLAALGQDITAPQFVKAKPGRLAKVTLKATEGTQVRWLNLNDKLDLIESENGLWAIVSSAEPGTYRVAVYGARLHPSGKSVVILDPTYIEVIVEGKRPTPDPVDPVDPVDPKPGDAPIKAPGFRVLMVYESGTVTKMPLAQQLVLQGKPVRDFLNANCVKGDGGQAEWRQYDPQQDISGEPKHFQDAMKRPRTADNWIIISNGTTGYEGPLPESMDKALEFLKKHLK